MLRKVLVLFLVCFGLASSVFAISVQNQRIYFPGSRTFSLVESHPKPMDTFTLGLGMNYALQPYEFGVAAGNVRVQGIVDHLFTFDFNGSYSFSDRFALGIGIPVHLTHNIISDVNLTMETPLNLGDIMLSGLYNIIPSENNTAGIGFSVVPFLSFPTGKASDHVGDSHVTGGFLLTGDVDLNGHYLGLNSGLRFRKEEDFLNLSVGSEFLYAFAYQHAIVRDYNLDGFFELQGSTTLKKFFTEEISSPFELRLGATKGFLENNQLKVGMAHGIAIGNGYGNPDYRMSLKVVYDHYLPRVKRVETIKVIEKVERVEQKLKELTIYYPTDESQVDPFYDKKIAGIAKILKENPEMGPLYIVGHTDDVATPSYNQKLSERRAKQAYESILQHSILADSVVWLGVGESDPIVDNATPANRALNRRTFFTFAKPKQLIEGYKRYGTSYDPKKYPSDSYTEVLKEQEVQNKEQVSEDTKTTIVNETTTTTETTEPRSKKKTSKTSEIEKDIKDADGKTVYEEEFKFDDE